MARLADQILTHVPGARTSGNRSLRMPCPACGRSRTLVYKMGVRFRCYGCGKRGSEEAFLRFLAQHGYSFTSQQLTAMPMDRLAQMLESLRPKVKAKQESYSIPLPEEARLISKDLAPNYFVNERGFPVALLEELGCRLCFTGPYAGGMIVPVHTLDIDAWVVYWTTRGEGLKKTDNPSAFPMGKLLFLYDLLQEEDPESVVLVEGIADALRALLYHREDPRLPHPVALLGNGLTDDRASALDLLARHGNLERVYIALDWDAREEARGVAAQCRKKLGGLDIRVVDLRRVVKDPDLASLAQWSSLISTAKPAKLTIW